jgi:hypothetical protein
VSCTGPEPGRRPEGAGCRGEPRDVHRWVLRFTPLLAKAARPCRHAVGSRWQVDETYVKVAGRWRYVYRAIDQFGQVIDVFVSPRRDLRAARRFFERAIGTTRTFPSEVVTDQAPTYPVVLEELLPGGMARHRSACQQPHRGRPQSPQGEVAADAPAQAGPQRQDRDRRPCLGAEPPSRATSWRSWRRSPSAWRSRSTSSPW